MSYQIRCLLFVLFALAAPNSSFGEEMRVEKPTRAHQPEIIGWVEHVKVMPPGASSLELEAKLAPSSSLSSLHAEQIKHFTKDKKKFVRFQIEDRQGKLVEIELPLSVRKKTTTADGSQFTRDVVKLPVCVAGKKLEVELLLSDRSNLEQELRIGRNELAGNFVVDPARTHMKTLSCDDGRANS
ncbi:MAG: ATP-dependent zinc protease [Bdellovibrionales bacterium]|nr:ATP-dependent zinc protease [Bdellovibrionales bacterium]